MQEDLINSDIQKDYDILLLQEPYIDSFSNIKAMRGWHVVYPTSHLLGPTPPRVVILVSTSLDTNSWSQINIPNTRDLITIKIKGTLGKLTLYNIYNDCQHLDTTDQLESHLLDYWRGERPDGAEYVMWCGDFN